MKIFLIQVRGKGAVVLLQNMSWGDPGGSIWVCRRKVNIGTWVCKTTHVLCVFLVASVEHIIWTYYKHNKMYFSPHLLNVFHLRSYLKKVMLNVMVLNNYEGTWWGLQQVHMIFTIWGRMPFSLLAEGYFYFHFKDAWSICAKLF